MSIIELAEVLRRRIKLIAVSFLSVVLLAFILLQFVFNPVHQFKKQILIGNINTSSSYVDPITNEQLIQTYIDLVESSAVLEPVISKLELKRTVKDVQDQLFISNNKNSLVVTLAVHDKSPDLAREIANEIAESSATEFKEVTEVDVVNILEGKGNQTKPEKIFPNMVVSMAIAAVVGLFAGVGIAMLKDYFDSINENRAQKEFIRSRTSKGERKKY
ncbi:YveK family protein [Mesobacillus selenatarsenatis]|uniref:Tyrosine-protein kinase transmembrane modulator EpsC n=1 Tax=Mesobacillus selenatarsenatis (strain DSM 18680 / JCM 14380 / FERM P-15431 / SF-1) TaxID=1321606 RepID=A0A0A8X691_MESS1|nr:Wzz/FepE/Etk N-terminal domain-containing protein [Mesobacillus selenatarsenatis]GAM15408.1 tyrosine-protein kinase transmembrane modulator EpsC [Mesobacillus selenatarsenatis SF-1]